MSLSAGLPGLRPPCTCCTVQHIMDIVQSTVHCLSGVGLHLYGLLDRHGLIL